MSRYNTHLIKSRRSYSVSQMTSLLSVDRKTCCRWLSNEGLRPVEKGVNPVLVMGADLIAFIRRKQSEKKASLSENEFYCFRCRKPVTAKPGSENTLGTGKYIGNSNLEQHKKVGKCEQCGTQVNRFLGVSQKD